MLIAVEKEIVLARMHDGRWVRIDADPRHPAGTWFRPALDRRCLEDESQESFLGLTPNGHAVRVCHWPHFRHFENAQQYLRAGYLFAVLPILFVHGRAEIREQAPLNSPMLQGDPITRLQERHTDGTSGCSAADVQVSFALCPDMRSSQDSGQGTSRNSATSTHSPLSI